MRKADGKGAGPRGKTGQWNGSASGISGPSKGGCGSARRAQTQRLGKSLLCFNFGFHKWDSSLIAFFSLNFFN